MKRTRDSCTGVRILFWQSAQPGAKIERYEPIGEGDFGSVWMAEQRKLVTRPENP